MGLSSHPPFCSRLPPPAAMGVLVLVHAEPSTGTHWGSACPPGLACLLYWDHCLPKPPLLTGPAHQCWHTVYNGAGELPEGSSPVGSREAWVLAVGWREMLEAEGWGEEMPHVPSAKPGRRQQWEILKSPLPFLALQLRQRDLCEVTRARRHRSQVAWGRKKNNREEHSPDFKNITPSCSCTKKDLSGFSYSLWKMTIKP